jgi:hypothetical protein
LRWPSSSSTARRLPVTPRLLWCRSQLRRTVLSLPVLRSLALQTLVQDVVVQ